MHYPTFARASEQRTDMYVLSVTPEAEERKHFKLSKGNVTRHTTVSDVIWEEGEDDGDVCVAGCGTEPQPPPPPPPPPYSARYVSNATVPRRVIVVTSMSTEDPTGPERR